MIETISSNFSVIIIARPPSRGTISPAMNAPWEKIMKLADDVGIRDRQKKPTEDGMNSDGICEECRSKGNEHGHRHEEHSWTAFD